MNSINRRSKNYVWVLREIDTPSKTMATFRTSQYSARLVHDLKCYEWICQGIKRRLRKTQKHEKVHQAEF